MVSKTDRLLYFLIVTVALYPVLVIYTIPGFSILPVSDILLIPTCIIFVVRKGRKIQVNMKVIFFIVYIFLRQIMQPVFQFDNFSSLLHICVYYIFLAIIIPNIGNDKYTVSPMLFVASFASVFIIVQTIVYFTIHKYISGWIPFFNYRDVLHNFENSITNSKLIFRPRSIFSEPSTYASYIAFALAYTVPKLKENKYLYLSVLYTIGMILSFSSTGAAILLIIWGVYFLRNYNLKKKWHIIVLPIFIILSIVVLNSDWYERVFTHVTDGGFEGRTGYAIYALENTKNIINLLFGKGIVSKDVFMPEFSIIFYYWGIIGYFILIKVFLDIFKRKSQNRIYLLLICGCLVFIGGLMASSFSVYYFYMIIAASKIENMENALISGEIIDEKQNNI